LRVVVDAMVWVSALTSRNPKSPNRHIFEAFKARAITVVTSGPLVDELAETLVEHMEMPPAEVERFVALLCLVAEVIPIRHQVMGCEDPDDDPVIETALTGHADLIVTRDRRLLELPHHVDRYLERAGVRFVRPEQLAAELPAF
jgi:putative PIN family toxin of toxin-antitoxin system